MAISTEQAQSMLNAGMISQDTYAQILAKQESEAQASDDPFARDTFGGTPQAPAPEPEPVSQPITPAPTPASPDPVPAPVDETAQTPLAPGQTRVTTSTERQATDAAREAQRALDDSYEKQRRALDEQADAGAKKAEEKFAYNEGLQRLEAEAAAKEEAIRAAGQEEIDDRMADLEAKTEEMANREYEGYWANQNVGSKILAAISLAMGAYSSSVGGGANHAMTIMQSAMDDDFKTFQANTQKKITAINSSRADIQTKRKLIADQIMGLQAKKQSDIAVIRNKIDNISNKFKGEDMKAKLAGLNAQLDEKAARSRLQFEQALGRTVQTKMTEAAAAGPRVDPVTGALVLSKEEAALRKEFNALPEIKEVKKIAGQVAAINAAEDNAAGDLSLIFSYMKVLDPGSTVREGEFATAEKATGVPARILNLHNKVFQGERLTAKQRESFKEQATKLYEARLKQVEPAIKQFRKLAERQGIDPDTIINESLRTGPVFPMTVTKEGLKTTVNNEAELKEAQSEGWK